MNTVVLEWFGSIVAILGAVMMASNTRFSPWAYPVWLLSSIVLIVVCLASSHNGLALREAVFTVINALGLWRWVILPRMQRNTGIGETLQVRQG